MREHTVTLPSGRVLQVREDGDPKGKPVFSLHGTPGSRLLNPQLVADAKSKGIRLIGYDRPGYGHSTPHPGRNKSDVAKDMASIADILGIDRFAVWGHSGGGAPALGCAALLPKRVVAAASFAGVAPFHAEGLDWMEGMGELNIEDTKLALSNPAAWLEKAKVERTQILGATASDLLEVWKSLISEADRDAITPQIVQFILEQIQEGLRPGVDGYVHDNQADLADWGFSVADIRVPVQIWHGGRDNFVPFGHGQWLAAHIPNVEAHLLPSEGHITLLQRIPEAHRWFLSKFDR